MNPIRSLALMLHLSGKSGYPESYSKGSQRLVDQAKNGVGAAMINQATRRGLNATQSVLRAKHSPSNNMKLRGFTNPLQQFNTKGARSWPTPSGQRSTSQQRVSAPTLNSPTPGQPIATQMPWNR